MCGRITLLTYDELEEVLEAQDKGHSLVYGRNARIGFGGDYRQAAFVRDAGEQQGAAVRRCELVLAFHLPARACASHGLADMRFEERRDGQHASPIANRLCPHWRAADR